MQLAAVHSAVALSGGKQTLPHLPQFDGELRVSTHEPPQLVNAPQSEPQAPALQTEPAAQLVPHLPQCAASDARSTQTAPHSA